MSTAVRYFESQHTQQRGRQTILAVQHDGWTTLAGYWQGGRYVAPRNCPDDITQAAELWALHHLTGDDDHESS